MIKEDVEEMFCPGRGKLRLIVITDGIDTDSPGNYVYFFFFARLFSLARIFIARCLSPPREDPKAWTP